MVRTAGAKNKPKSAAELVKLLQSAAEKEGKKFEFTLDGETIVANTEAAQKAAIEAKRQGFSNLEIVIDDSESDTFKCGSCGAEMPEALPVCPSCGEKLTW